MTSLTPHMLQALVVFSGIGAAMVWRALRTGLIEERHALGRCAVCGRFLRPRERCSCTHRS
jgi:hypothetical protein